MEKQMKDTEAKQKKQDHWMRRRHRVVLALVRYPLTIWSRLACRVKVTPCEGKEPCLILYNHQTPYDQFFVMMGFRQFIYYLITEDVMSNGWLSSLIRWLGAPIPIKKQTTDLNAIKSMLKVAREGGTIALAPEGNRTYSGKTEHMSTGIARLARKMRLPIVLYRIEGGYGLEPRWGDARRRGPVKAGVYRVITPEEYAPLSDDDLFALIQDGLYVNESAADARYVSGRRAEYLERAVYVCPYCGLSRFESRGNETECLLCHRKITYGEDKRLSGVGFDFPFSFVNDWYEYQNQFVRELDVLKFTDSPLYTDPVRLSEVIPYRRKVLLRSKASLKLYGNRVVFDEGAGNSLVFSFDELSAAAVLGRNKLNLYHGEKIYQIRGDKRFNALKYANIYYRYEQMKRGDNHGEFLGL